MLLLIGPDGALGRPEIGGFASLDLDDDQLLTLPGDQVGFSLA